ncbi:MAG: ribonuclease P protein component [Patescibacteria group bacterium]
MLPKTRRLTKKKDFMKLAVQGRSVFGPYATLRINHAQSGTKSRIAFITSTKVFKLAVDRNRAKRRMREVLRGLLSEIPDGLSLLFVLKPESRDAKYESLVEEVKRLLSKIPEALQKPAKPSSRGKKFTTKMTTPRKP